MPSDRAARYQDRSGLCPECGRQNWECQCPITMGDVWACTHCGILAGEADDPLDDGADLQCEFCGSPLERISLDASIEICEKPENTLDEWDLDW